MYRLLEWAFAYDDGSGLPDAGAYAAELKNVTATADGKPVQGFDRHGARRGPDLHSGDIMVQFPVQTGGA